MCSQNKYFDFTKPADVTEALRIVYESDFDGSEDDSDEENMVIPDFREEPAEDEYHDFGNTADAVLPVMEVDDDPIVSHTASTTSVSSDSEDDVPLAEVQRQIQSQVKILDVPNILCGKNGFKWSGEKGLRHRTPARNIVLHLPGNKGESREIRTGLESWKLCFTQENLDKIVTYTNKEIAVQKSKYGKKAKSSENDTEETNKVSYTKYSNSVEIQALFGLLYYAGVMKMSGVFTKELFDKDGGMPIFRATMPEARFRFLLNCLRFDDKDTRVQRRELDKLAAFRDVFEKSVNKMKDLYVPSEYTTIDEQLVGFRGRCPFKIYIPTKPDKYGIKIVMCCDSKTAFVLDAEVYIGKNSTPPDTPIAQYYCDKLTASFQGTNRNLTMDNWFTSVQTANVLLEKKITVVGTVRKNKKEIPPSFLNLKGREVNSAMFCYSNNITLLSYCPPKATKKIVLMLSTMHEKGDEPNSTTLPEIIQFYNSTKGGVDTLDQLCHTYTTARKTRRWPLRLCYNLLDIVGYNSMVLLRGSTAQDKEVVSNRREYLKKLALDLVKPHMQVRLETITLRTELRDTICRILKISPQLEAPTKPAPSAGRCTFCPRSKDRKSRNTCAICKKFICVEHQKRICLNCGESSGK